jgi:hypothetical protein
MNRSFLFFLALLLVSLFTSALDAFTPPGPDQSFVYPSPAVGNYVNLAFDMAESGQVHLLIYNETGSLVDDEQLSFSAGVQKIRLLNFLFANGAYVYTLQADYDSGRSEKMTGRFAVSH